MMMIFGPSALNRVGYLRWIVIIIAGAFRMGAATPCMSQDTPAPVDLVNPYIGSISHLLIPTFPTVHRPFGMIRFWPETNPGIPDTWLADRIFGFPLNRPEYRGNPCTTVMPFMGMKSLQRNHPGSSFDHDFETVTPYYYSVELEDLDMKVEFSPTERCGMFVFSPAKTDDLVLLFQTKEESRFQLKSNQNLTGYENYRGVRQYFTIFFNHPVKRSGYLNESGRPVNSRAHKGKKLYWFVVFDGSVQVKMNYAISWINDQQASRNLLNENPGWDFHKTVKKGRAAWNRELGRITVRGGTKNQQITFYTALYRSMERMININEYGRYFSGYDHRVHKTKHNFYVDDWSWDTYRTLHPLRLLFAPDRERDMIRSYILMYRQSGWMPTFPEIYGDAKCMIGHHQAAIIADAWFKGIRGFDIKKAYEGLRKNAFESTMLPWREGPATELDRFYREHGYFPALAPGEKESEPEADGFEKRQAVAVTLEHSYDDWCLGRLAKAWNHPGDTAELMKRSLNYQNVFNPETGFMSPKKADGSWVTPFNPKTSGGTGCRDYFAEVNSWNYTWSVPQDPQGLIKLMGGNEAFIAKLDQLFEEPLVGYGKWGTLSDQPDATGLTGQFVMGNEPGFHIPYLYTLAGAPWKTQKRVRQLMDTWFRNDLMGICGDEDGGALSSWYVFSAMGFYPVTPGKPEYVLGSPIFEEIRIDVGHGKKFVISTPFVSRQNKYIQHVTLNGKELTGYILKHQDIINGGSLVLDLGTRPNK